MTATKENPSLPFVKLEPQQKRQFDEQGYLILRAALDAATIERLIVAGDRLIASEVQSNRQRSNGGLYDGFRNVLAMDEAFLPLLTHPATFSLVTQLLGPHLSLLTSHLIYRHPDPPGAPASGRMPGWHRDHYVSMRDLGHAQIPRHSLKIAYYLTDLSEPNSGATMMAAGSNHLKAPIEIAPGQADPATMVEPRLQPGDCVFFENRTWHAGAANLSRRIRKAVMFGYCYDWIRPTDYRRQPPALVAKLNPLQRALVGEPAADGQEFGGAFQFDGGANPIADWHTAQGA